MHLIWTRVLVASLILLGDGAFASEITHSNDVETATNSSIFKVSLPTLLDDTGSDTHAIPPGVNTAKTAFNLTSQTNAAASHLVFNANKYNPINPRASPTPAN